MEEKKTAYLSVDKKGNKLSHDVIARQRKIVTGVIINECYK
jgi:hypothetical protein